MSNPNGRPGVKIRVTIDKKRKTFKSIEDTSKAFKIPYSVLYARIFTSGWNATEAVTTPVRKRSKHKKSKTTKKRK